MKKIYVLFLLLALVIEAYSQQVPMASFDIRPKSPTVEQFTRYDELPISEYSGLPQISIPIYTIEEDGFTFPLNLSYHAGGIKVNQDASWVGLGWDLSLGSITQIVNDVNDLWFDDVNYKRALPDFWSGSSYPYGYSNYPVPCSVWSDFCMGYSTTVEKKYPEAPRYSYMISSFRYLPINGDFRQKDEAVFDSGVSTYDSEPDVFKASIFGVTLNFIIDFNSGTKRPIFVVLNKKGYKITYDNASWAIETPTGEIFYFTDKVVNKSFTGTSQGNGSSDIPGTKIWMLNKIKTKKGTEITVEYTKSENKVTTWTNSQSLALITGGKVNTGLDYKLIGFSGYYTDNKTVHTVTYTNEEYPLYIKTINFPKGSIEFNISEREDVLNSYKLDSIRLFNNQKRIVKDFHFSYDYFIEKEGGKRLKLLSMNQNRPWRDTDDDSHAYSFTYNSMQLPKINSYSQDYWGYYNGHDNASLIPNPTRFGKNIDKTYTIVGDTVKFLFTTPGHNLGVGTFSYKTMNGMNDLAPFINNNMSANVAFAKAGILEEIKYPTGGKVSFDYELNEFDNYWVPDFDSIDNKISKGMGLRVKSITYKNFDDNKVKETQYQYNSGKAIIPLSKLVETFNQKYVQLNQGSSLSYTDIKVMHMTANGFYTTSPLAGIKGVGYGNVIRKDVDYNNQSNTGRTELFYNNRPDLIPGIDPNYYNVMNIIGLPSYKDWSSPANGTIAKTLYFNNKNELQKEVTFLYENDKSSLYYGAKIQRYTSMFKDPTNPGSYPLPQHIVAFYPLIDFESLLTDRIEYNYIESDTLKVQEKYLYTAINKLFSKTITPSSQSDVGYSQHYNYHPTYKGLPISFFQGGRNPFNITYKFETINNRLLLTEEKKTEGLNIEGNSRVISYRYNLDGNPIQQTASDSSKVSYLWGYNGQYPIAEIKNATYEQVISALGVSPESLSSAPEPVMDAVNGLREKLLKAEVTTYTYSPLTGIKTTTDAKGQVTKYEYDWIGRLSTILLAEDGRDKIIKHYQYEMPGYTHLRNTDYVKPKPEPIDPENLTPDPYTKGKASTVLINIGAKGEGSYGLTGWNYDTQKVEVSNVITKTYKTIEASEYQWTTENLRLKYGVYGNVNMTWLNLTQADVDKYANEYLNGQKIPLEEFEQIFGTWVTLYPTAMMYRKIEWGVPTGPGTFDKTWGIPTKEDIWQLYGQAPRTTGNVYEDIKDFLFASACDNKYNWTQNMFNRRNISGLTLTPLGMKESNDGGGGATYGFGQVASLQTSIDTKVETLSDRDLSGTSGIISNDYTYHFTQARHRRPLTDQELGYKMYIDAANDQILMLAYNQASSLPELAKGLERGIALRYANREHLKVLKKWSEIQAEAKEIKSKLAPTNYPAPPALLPCEKEPEPEITADPYTKGKESAVLINIGAKGDGSYGLTGWNYDSKKVELSNVITKTYKTIEAGEYQWTTENLRLKYGVYASVNMNWVNFTQADVDKYSTDYLSGKSVPLDEFEQVYGTWSTLYDVAMMYRNIYWGVPTGPGTFDHTWGIPTKEDIWQMYGQAPRISDNLYNDIKDFLFASSSDFNFSWTQGLFKNKNTSGLTLTPLGMRESYNGGAIYGFGQVTSLQTSTWKGIETLSDRDLSSHSGLISNNNSFHFTQARHRRPLTDQELGYKMYIDAANDQVLMLPYDQISTLPELPKGLERGVALRYANRKAMKVVKKWSEIQAEAAVISSKITKAS